MSDLLSRIKLAQQHDYHSGSDDDKPSSDEDTLGPPLTLSTAQSIGRSALLGAYPPPGATESSDSELDGDAHNPLLADGVATWVMLTNLLQRCRGASDKGEQRAIDTVVESERWAPLPAKGEGYWSRAHLSAAVDWKPFEGVGTAQSPELAKANLTRGRAQVSLTTLLT
jgi:hypothetical protein